MAEQLDLAVIGKRIRENRELLKLTREAFAEKADLSVSFIQQIENGDKTMKITSLCKVCKALGVSADYLLFGREAVVADNLSRAFLHIAPEDRAHLEQLLFTAAEIAGASKERASEGENT